MSNPMEKYLVRVENNNGAVFGTGFLIDKMEVATCAHVIGDLLGFKIEISITPPQDIIWLTFPYITKDERFQAQVIRCDHKNDIAILRLKTRPPDAAEPACFSGADIDDLRNHLVRTSGVPKGYDNFRESDNWRIKGRSADGRVQLERDIKHGSSILPGFSGAPVFDEQLNQVVGMVCAIADDHYESKTAFMIPEEILKNVYPILQEKVNMTPVRPSREICEEYLKESFYEDDKNDLLSVCKNNYPKLRRKLTDQYSVDKIIDMLISYCEVNDEFNSFWKVMKKNKPNRYDEFYSEWQESFR